MPPQRRNWKRCASHVYIAHFIEYQIHKDRCARSLAAACKLVRYTHMCWAHSHNDGMIGALIGTIRRSIRMAWMSKECITVLLSGLYACTSGYRSSSGRRSERWEPMRQHPRTCCGQMAPRPPRPRTRPAGRQPPRCITSPRPPPRPRSRYRSSMGPRHDLASSTYSVIYCRSSGWLYSKIVDMFWIPAFQPFHLVRWCAMERCPFVIATCTMNMRHD